MFSRTAVLLQEYRRHKAVSVRAGLAGFIMLLVGVACLPDPRMNQSVQLLEQLSLARGIFAERPQQLEEACRMIGDIQTRLFGEPGLVDVRPAWPELRDAASALHAVCSAKRLLAQPSSRSAAVDLARRRWQQGMQREMAVACDHLRSAATALARPAPC
jgi:hypothetical protein